MSLVAFASAKGSPGVTTLACVVGAVWPEHRPVVVAECDQSGGDICSWFGLPGDAGLVSLAVSLGHRRSSDRPPGSGHGPLDPHLQSLPGGLQVLVGMTGPDQQAVLSGTWEGVRDALRTCGADVLVDLGRLAPAPAESASLLAASAAASVLVCRDDASSVAHARACVGMLRETTAETVVAVVGGSRTRHRAIARELGGLALAAIADDPAAAAVVAGRGGSPRRFGRSALVASARALADELAELAESCDGARRAVSRAAVSRAAEPGLPGDVAPRRAARMARGDDGPDDDLAVLA